MFQKNEARRLRKSLGQALELVSQNSVEVDGNLWIYIHMVNLYICIHICTYILFSLFSRRIYLSQPGQVQILKTKKLSSLQLIPTLFSYFSP